MAIQNYAVVKVLPVAARLFPAPHEGEQPHYHIEGVGSDGSHFDIAVDVESRGDEEVWYCEKDNFTPPNAAGLTALLSPMTLLKSEPGGLALDYVRTTPALVTADQMTLLPIDAQDPSDFHNKLDSLVQKAIQQQATMYAFGQWFVNESGRPNPFFGFTPDQGAHDIHLNQLDGGRFQDENGPWQDGALFVEWPDGTWSAVFIAFQSQSFVTRESALVR